MACSSSASLKFKVLRMPAELVSPAAPTPRELKLLSDVDDQAGLRFHIPAIHFFRRRRALNGGDDDPVGVLRDAVGRALVHYYPLAGRLRELEGRKLAVDCTGQGVLFTEAHADVTLEQFGDDLQPPFPCLEELMLAVPDGEAGVLDFPLVLFQVTRLACGGFIMTVQMQHAMADAPGLVQFLAAVAELARGAAAPTVRPVWSRELLMAPRDDDDHGGLTPRFAHREYDEVPDTDGTLLMPPRLDDMAHRSFFFGPQETAAARSHLPPPLRHTATAFELLTGCLWRCRTVALSPAPHEVMRVLCIVGVRGRTNRSNGADAIPSGYYGNAFAFPVAVSTAGELQANPVGHAVELVRNAKREVAGLEYLRSLAGLMVRRGRPHFAVARAYLVSDVSRSGIRELDFGWGKPVYAGPAKGGVGAIPGVASFLIACRNARGEEGIVVPVCLPAGPAMDKFVQEMGKLMRPAVDVPAMLPRQQPVVGVFPAIKSAL